MSDPSNEPLFAGAVTPPQVDYFYVPALKRNSLTTFFRWLLAIPHFLVMLALGIAAVFVAIYAWFGALFTARVPDGAASFLEETVSYFTRVGAYTSLITDVYPPFRFSEVEYPVRVVYHRSTLNRGAVLFRWVLAVPAGFILEVVGGGVGILNVGNWFISFITGKTPRALYELNLAFQRYSARFYAYALLLSPTQPWDGLFGDTTDIDPLAEPVETSTVTLSSNARTLMWVAIVLGALTVAFRSRITR